MQKELQRVSDAVREIQQFDQPEQARQQRKPLSRLKKFIEKLDDGNKTVGKALKTLEDGRETAAKIVDLYNKVGPWCGLPGVPNLFKTEKA